MITNSESGTRVEEVADGIYQIHTPVPPSAIPGGFSFNQYLIVDEQPTLFHTGGRQLFPLVRQAIASVIPVEKLRWLAFSHVESDECGALNQLLAAAPGAQPLCGMVAANVSINDLADRPPRGLTDGETVSLGKRSLTWIDAPHFPHAWECGFMFESSTKTLLCGDLFTQPGDGNPALSEGDILGPSEAFRGMMDYYSHTKNARALVEKVASTNPRTLACMHGSAWRGDGAKLLRALGEALDR